MSTTFLAVVNRAEASLAVAVNDVATSWEVTSGSGDKFGSLYPFHITCADEIVSCTNRSGDVLTVVRAQQDTIAASHPQGAKVELRLTAKSISDLNTAVNTLESAGGGDMTKAVYDPDADGDIAEAQLQLNYPTHSNATDHAQNTDTDLDSTFEATFEKVANKGAVSGYCGLDGSGLVDGDDLPALSTTKKGGAPATGTPSGKFLKDDNTWAAPAGGGESENIVRTTADITNATTTFADITGLTFTALANKDYIIEAWVIFQSNTATTGIKFALNGPASPTAVGLLAHIPIALTLYASCVTLAARAYQAGNPSASVDAINSNLLCKVDALVRNGATQGTIALRFAAETTGTVKVMTGSVLRYRQTN